MNVFANDCGSYEKRVFHSLPGQFYRTYVVNGPQTQSLVKIKS
jgi:hypothetical protein